MSTPPPRVSVIVRTKNRTQLLSRALKDISAQEFTSWELVVVNDGGDPDPVDEAITRSGIGDRGHVIHIASSAGMEAASNHGIRATSGEFIAIHDDDDTWAPDFLTATVAWLDEHPADLAVSVGTEIVVEKFDGDLATEVRREPFGPPHGVVTAFDLLISNRFVPISLVVRRSVVDELGGFDESLPVVGDWDFNLRLALHGHVGYLPEPVRAFWHQRPETHGDHSNSVHAADQLHRQYDRIVRDRALRQYVTEHGTGDLLFTSKWIDERIAASEHHTYLQVRDAARASEAAVAAAEARLESKMLDVVRHYSLGATFRRNMRRLLRRRPY